MQLFKDKMEEKMKERYEICKKEERITLQGEGLALCIKDPNINVKVIPNDDLEDVEIQITIKAKGKSNLKKMASKLIEEAVKVKDIELLKYLTTIDLDSKVLENKVFEYGSADIATYFDIKADLSSLTKAIKLGNEIIVDYILEKSTIDVEKSADYIVKEAMWQYHDAKTVDILLNMEISIELDTLKKIEKYCNNAEKAKLFGIVRD